MCRVIVLTRNRPDSLSRLLYSLKESFYYGDRVDLDVWIDRLSSGLVDNKTLQVSNDFYWRYGVKTTHVQESNVGLSTQWKTTWNASLKGSLKENTKEIAVILEDDLKVSPFFYKWLKKCHRAYGKRSDFAGCTLQRASLCAKQCKKINGSPPNTTTNFLYPLIGTWGYSPSASSWVEFTNWDKNFKNKPYVKGLTPTNWYKGFERSGRCPGVKCMWEMTHIKYSDVFNKKTAYVKCPNEKTLASNYLEPGLHFKRKKKKTLILRF